MFRFRNSSVLFCRKTMKTIHNLQKVLCSHRAEYVDDRSVKPEWIAYGHAKQGSFLQAPPKLQNPYVADPPLRSYLRHHVPEEVSKEIESDLKPFGDRIVNEIDALGWECERNLPVLHHQNAWGERVDELITCSAWKKQHDISAEEGLVAIGYERKLQQWREELASYAVSDDIASCLPDLKIAQNTMYRARAAVRPPLPKTLLEIKLEGQWTQTRDGKIFLLFDTVEEGNRVMAFCSPESLEILCHNEQIFFDGTFKLAPKLFCQLYTIHGLYKGKIFPLVYSFLENKKKSTCITLFKNLKTQAEKFGFKFEPSFAMLDYERGATNALEEVLPTIKNKGCYFHYAQAIWRKVQELGLKKSYINCEDTQRWIRRIIALLLVPIEKMSKAFLLLVEDAPAQTTAVRTMTDYLVDTWLDENAVFEIRLHQACKLYLYSPSAGLYTCPLAMTDGAAKTIEVMDTKQRFRNAFENLTSRDPKKFWTSGQWMTEKRGGSDVARGTETVAIADADFYRLYGYKWFTSATDSNMALTLAQEKGSTAEIKKEKGLTMFYLETKNSEGKLNNLQLVRLKNKLGTRQVPTAELLLDGSVAYKMSERGDGIAAISNMLTITRLYNAISSVAAMRRILMLARDYSHRRKAFGQPLYKFPLHAQILSKMEVKVRGCFLFMMKTAVLLGKVDTKVATADEVLLLRLLLPILKLYTAKQAVSVVSEGIEAFGGQGYMEDTGLPVLLRDCQVLPIWEGTTNILSLDVLRSFSKSNFETLHALHRSISSCIENAERNRDLCISCAYVNSSIKYILDFVQKFPEQLNVACRDLSYSIAKTYIGALLIENANATNSRSDIISAKRWCELQDLCLLSNHHEFLSYTEGVHDDTELVMEGYIP